MKKLILLFIVLTAQVVMAMPQTTDIAIDGVDCAGCVKKLTKKVCKDPDLAKNFSKCQVTLVDADKALGKISIQTKDGQPVDMTALGEAVKKAGSEYSIKTPANENQK